MVKKPDYYSMLKVPRNAPPEEIRRAYFVAARRLHPDRNVAPGDTEFFLDVQEAYEVLSDANRRAKYDASLPPEEAPDLAVRHKVLFSRPSLLRADEPQLLYALIEYLPPPAPASAPKPPLNLCLVLDRSTSMQGGNLDIVKATAIQILRKMRPNDIFSVVAFSDRAEVILPAMRETELSKLEAKIQMLQTSGGTEIYQGLQSGYNEISRHADKEHVNQIILITDGRTFGDDRQCLELAQKCAGLGIGISALGIGNEWNDNFLDEMTSRTGGSSMYVSQPEDIQRLLLEKFNRLWQVYAEDTEINYKPINGVTLQVVFRLEPEADMLSLENPIKPGVVPSEHALRILMEFSIQPGNCQGASVDVFDGETTLQISSRGAQPHKQSLHFSRPVTTMVASEPPPQEILEAVSNLTLYRLQEQARLEVSNGEYDHAAKRLQRLATHLLAQGKKQLAQTTLLEADNILKNQAFSKEGDKRIKYGTRALLLSGKESQK